MTNEHLTRRGICKNLAYSPYQFTNLYGNNVYTLSFSSKLHLDKFTKGRDKNHAMIYNDIYKRYKIMFDCTLLADLNLYQKIEKRGCYIILNDSIYTDYTNLIV